MDEFLEKLFTPSVYDIGPTESVCIGVQYKSGAYVARPWPFTDLTGEDTHFSLHLFEFNTPTTAHDFRRRKERWTGTPLIGLDDVGEVKNGVRIKEPPVKPTFIIETKPGSTQWVYALNRIVRDPSKVATVLRSASEGGLTDPCVTDITRIFRLPGSLPPNKQVPAKLVYSDFSRRFNPDVLVEKAFQVPLVQETVSVYRTGGAVRRGVPVEIKTDDPLLQWLSDGGHVLGQFTNDGWVPIRCPFSAEHSSCDETGTYYHPPNSADSERAIYCFHGHCKNRRSKDYRDRFADLGAPVVAVMGDKLGRARFGHLSRSGTRAERRAKMMDVKI
ncbi:MULTISPECIES: hypothetical protein [unclassified Ruegeria]|uniref:hypothetical protein n=1 Tax=unclassified Ruegeria TaxID=2625375 RepID=UPI001490D626|nr:MULTISPECIES: hypothetical protein [unclassified Ruegeria]NOD36023.1 hypothetical protein [Ruegeria sp. HKCCD7296]NOE43416.1 hypothetical protein [Ruegeria sp. HKCCD7319]